MKNVTVKFSEFPKKISIETIVDSNRNEHRVELETLESMDAAIDVLCEKLKPKTPEEEQKLFDLCPYFGMIWPSAKGLSQYLVKHFCNTLSGASVLELGCGLALPSILAAKLGAKVTALDYHPDVREFLASNLKRNKLDSVRYFECDWQNPENLLAKSEEKFDFVIGSDILYERRHIEPVARSFAHFSHPQSKIILADPGRGYLQGAVDELKRLGFKDKQMVVENGVFVIELER